MTIDQGAREIHYILTGEYPKGEDAVPTPSRPIVRFKCVNCGTEEPNDFYASNRRKCRACMKKPPEKTSALEPLEVAVTHLPSKPIPVMKTCRDCGHEFTAYHHGNIDMPICKVCFGGKVSESKKQKNSASVDHPTIELNFGMDRELLTRIQVMARSQRRTVQQQIFFMLDGAMELKEG